MYVFMFVCVCIYIYIYIYIYVYIHTHTHVCAYECICNNKKIEQTQKDMSTDMSCLKSAAGTPGLVFSYKRQE
jgi:hypothetical protein